MRWHRNKIGQENVVVDDPRVAEMLAEITSSLNSTATRLKDFSADLQVNINNLRQYAANAEKRVQGNK
jgi:hypothetical protein